MFYRQSLVLVFLFLTLAHSGPVDIFISQIKASGKTGLKFRLAAKCEFRDAEPDTPVEGVTFQIQLDTSSTKFSVSVALLFSKDHSDMLQAGVIEMSP